MEIPVLIEKVPGDRFRATGGLGFSAEGSTRQEAFQKLRAQLNDRISAGAEVVPLQLAAPEHPWLRFAGTLRDDPLYDEWRAAIAERRMRIDADADIP